MDRRLSAAPITPTWETSSRKLAQRHGGEIKAAQIGLTQELTRDTGVSSQNTGTFVKMKN